MGGRTESAIQYARRCAQRALTDLALAGSGAERGSVRRMMRAADELDNGASALRGLPIVQEAEALGDSLRRLRDALEDEDDDGV